MTDSQKLDIQSMRTDLVIELLTATIGFIHAPHTNNPHKHWNKAQKEYNKIIKKHQKRIDEYYDNIASIEVQVS